MPTGTSSGYWTPVRVPPVAVAAMPKLLREAWDRLADTVAALDTAKQAERSAAQAARQAPRADAAAAADAVAAGKPIPPATTAKAEAAADLATRERAAHLDLAKRAERDYLAAVPAHADEWRDNLTTAAEHHADDARHALDALGAAAEALAATVHARRSTEDPARSHGVGGGQITVRVGSTSPNLHMLVTAIRAAIAENVPARVDADADAYAAQWAAYREQIAKYPGGFLPPGVDAVLPPR